MVGGAAGLGHGPALYRCRLRRGDEARPECRHRDFGKDHGVDVRNPATGEVIDDRRGPHGGRDRRRHRPGRRRLRRLACRRPGDRARLLRRFAGGRRRRTVEELAGLEVANAGHVIGNARWEAGNVRDVLEFYAAAPERHSGRQIPVPGGIDVTFHEPLGVVGVIVPWNFPMAIAGWGFAPALAAGQHRRAQAGRADPAQRAAHRRAGARGGAARGRPADPAGQGQRRGRALRGPSRRAQGVLHRLDRGGARRSWPAAPRRSSG